MYLCAQRRFADRLGMIHKSVPNDRSSLHTPLSFFPPLHLSLFFDPLPKSQPTSATSGRGNSFIGTNPIKERSLAPFAVLDITLTSQPSTCPNLRSVFALDLNLKSQQGDLGKVEL
mmetsp:Transcript_2021/g.4386  ORF Transcript_2021/g.4386 Transcript_2021/m.4386 type:complete len:116 (-) Transcript_2021:624-971(-)